MSRDVGFSMSAEAEMDPDFQSGIALMKDKEYSQAAEILSGVLQKFVDQYGELAVECSEIYYQYGLALLREFEAKEDAEGGPDVFGQSVPKQVPTGKEEGGGEGASGEGAALEGVEEGEGEGEEDEEDGEDGEEDDEEDDNGGEGNSSGAKAPEGSGEDGAAPADDDPLQLAWEVLDVCRNILEKNGLDPLKLADTYASLGDINLRNDQFDMALNDYNKCLEMRETMCSNDDRLLIEVHHQLAMTHISHPQPQKVEALVHWKAAVEVCERRVANLVKLVGMEGEGKPIPGSSVKPQPKSWTEREMNEIEEIQEDIKGRIEAEETQDESVPSSSGAAGSSTGGASSLGADTLKQLAASVGMGAKEGFAEAPVGAPVKTLGTFGKGKGKAAAASSTANVTSGAAGAGAKRPAEEEAGKGAEGGAGGEGVKKAKTEKEASAAPTPAREEGAAANAAT